jgi:hypothetical protein
MPRHRVLQELQSFARRYELPEPALAADHDGQHAFVYSADGSRRYAYSLTWAPEKPHILWIMLNPGTGETEGRRRNTFERCKQWSHSFGYGGLLFGNLFSLRSKSAKALLALPNPPDPLNEHALIFLSKLAPETIVAWGGHGARSDRSNSLHRLLVNPKCLGYTKSGQPRHPLYVAGCTSLVEWRGHVTAGRDG